jgi:hypothetical protein
VKDKYNLYYSFIILNFILFYFILIYKKKIFRYIIKMTNCAVNILKPKETAECLAREITGQSNFVNHGNNQVDMSSGVNLVIFLVVFVLILILYSYVARHLWNNMLVKAVSIAKPVGSVVDMLGLMVLLSIINA